jgi:hypothetical protein
MILQYQRISFFFIFNRYCISQLLHTKKNDETTFFLYKICLIAMNKCLDYNLFIGPQLVYFFRVTQNITVNNSRKLKKTKGHNSVFET